MTYTFNNALIKEKFLFNLKKAKNGKVNYLMLLPFMVFFTLFTIIPVIISFVLSFTDFNMLESMQFVGFDNYMRMFLDDDVFVKAIANTLIFAVITGPISYFACLMFAWLINELSPTVRSIMTFIFYAPTMSSTLFVVWTFIFSGDSYGMLNALLSSMGVIDEPVQWLTDTSTMLVCCMVVQVWMSLGSSFLSFIAGFQTVDRSVYEAAAIDGIRNRVEELVKITLPLMGPQLLFGAVMQISGSFAVGSVCQSLCGYPTTDDAATTLVLLISDVGTSRYEMGYACAMSFFLFAIMLIVNHVIQSVIRKHADA